MGTNYSDVARKSYRAWNEACFDGELPAINEDVPSGLSVFADDLGRFTEALGGYLDDAQELGCFGRAIYINTAALNDAISGEYSRFENPYRLIADSMLHEMVHLWCDLHEIYDVDSSGMHTDDFRRAANSHLLECEEGIEGFNKTSASEDAWKAFNQAADEELRELVRD